jgi:hypothetical protein
MVAAAVHHAFASGTAATPSQSLDFLAAFAPHLRNNERFIRLDEPCTRIALLKSRTASGRRGVSTRRVEGLAAL